MTGKRKLHPSIIISLKNRSMDGFTLYKVNALNKAVLVSAEIFIYIQTEVLCCTVMSFTPNLSCVSVTFNVYNGENCCADITHRASQFEFFGFLNPCTFDLSIYTSAIGFCYWVEVDRLV